MNTIYHNLELLKAYALAQAQIHGCNYTIIIHNPVNGQYNKEQGSTYEFVRDSYFEKERDCVKLITTDEMRKGK